MNETIKTIKNIYNPHSEIKTWYQTNGRLFTIYVILGLIPFGTEANRSSHKVLFGVSVHPSQIKNSQPKVQSLDYILSKVYDTNVDYDQAIFSYKCTSLF